MLPTLKPGQDILVWCWFNCYKVGDVVVIKESGKEMVKRIHKISGQEYFLQGDNKDASTDSRAFGWITRDKIVGKMVFAF